MEVIDPHVHVWTRAPKHPFAAEVTQKPEKDAPPETLLALMKANGLKKRCWYR
jgi:predicted TIM-barrel fold metal-dependent hydrolase